MSFSLPLAYFPLPREAWGGSVCIASDANRGGGASIFPAPTLGPAPPPPPRHAQARVWGGERSGLRVNLVSVSLPRRLGDRGLGALLVHRRDAVEVRTLPLTD